MLLCAVSSQLYTSTVILKSKHYPFSTISYYYTMLAYTQVLIYSNNSTFYVQTYLRIISRMNGSCCFNQMLFKQYVIYVNIFRAYCRVNTRGSELLHTCVYYVILYAHGVRSEMCLPIPPAYTVVRFSSKTCFTYFHVRPTYLIRPFHITR